MKTKQTPKNKDVRYKNVDSFIKAKLEEAKKTLKNVDLTLLKELHPQE